MKRRSPLVYFDQAMRNYILAAHSQGEMEERIRKLKMDEIQVDVNNGVSLAIHNLDSRVYDIETWRKKVSKYIRATGRPKK